MTLRCSSGVPQYNQVAQMPLATIALLCKPTIDNFRTRPAPWRHLSGYTVFYLFLIDIPCRVGSVGSVSASRSVGHEFASRPGHIKDHHKNGTNCLPA